MKKNNKGIALINIILFLFVIICGLFIFFILKDSNNQVVNISEESTNDLSDINEENYNEASKFYYNQLNNVGKSIYDTLANNVQSLKSGTQRINFETKDPDAVNHIQAALDALFLDKPDIFWIDILKIAFLTKKTTFLTNVDYSYYIEPKTGENSYLIDSMKSEYDVINAIDKVEKRISNIVLRANGTTYDKVKFVHDEIVNTINYDQTLGVNSSNLYGALVENSCICEGYAEAFKVILDELDIPCVIVYGDGIDSEGNTEAHAWNYVKMDNEKWYAVDTTWDDPIIIGGSNFGVNEYKYFLKGSKNFLDSHKPNGDVSGEGQVFDYPTLSEADY